MHRMVTYLAVLVPLSCSAWACSDSNQTSGPSLEVNVSPLSLPGISEACYGINVNNGTGDLVWSRTKVCSGQFGNGAGGDISYVGPCDADSPAHTVTLFIENLRDDAGLPLAVEDWQNPCESPTGCTQSVACVENADTPVTFNITVMRRAYQGFFDLAVDFEDVFCSGKVDCEGTEGDPIELLHNRDGERDQTVVVALACTGGPGEGDTTTLHMNDIRIVCADPLATRYVPAADPLFGACFETATGSTITSHGLGFSVFAVTPDPLDLVADPIADEIYSRALSYNATFDPNGSPV